MLISQFGIIERFGNSNYASHNLQGPKFTIALVKPTGHRFIFVLISSAITVKV